MAESTRVKAINAAIANDRSVLDEARTAREQAVAQGARAREIQRAASRDARRAQAEYKAASDLLKSTPGGFETMLKYRQGGYDTPEERSVPYGMPVRPGTKLTNGDGGAKKMFFDRAPDPARDIYQQAQEAEAKRLRDTVPIDDYMKLRSGYRWKQLTPGVDGPVNPYAQPVRTGNAFYENQRDLGYESAQSVLKQWAQLRLNAIDSEISKYEKSRQSNDAPTLDEAAARDKEYDDRIKELERERANLKRAYGLKPRAADWGGVLGNSSMRGISSFDLSIANTLNLLGYVGQKVLMLGDLTREQWEEMNMPTTALKNRLQAEHDRSDRLTNEAAGDSKAAQFVGNLTTGTVAALPQAVLAFFTGGASLGTTAGLNAASAAATGGLGTTIYNYVSAMAQNPSFWMSFAQTAGNGFEDAKADGAGDLAAMSYAIINGLLNAGVEVSGGIEQLPANVRGGGAPLRAWIESSLDEGKEEVIQGIIERGLQSFVYGKNNPLFSVSNPDAVFNPLTSLEEGGMGTIIGALLGGGQALAQTGINAINARQSAPASAGAAADVRAGTDTAVEQNAAQSGAEGVQAQQRVEDILTGKPAESTGGKKSGTVVQVLRSKLPELSLLPSVARVDGTELPSQGNATSRALEFLQKIGNKVTRSGFGDVLFSRSKVKNALVGHGASAAKIETIAAVPAVIEHGAQVDYVENYEGRGYDTYMFAAPVTHRGSPVYLGVVVAKDAQSGRYYVHEVVDSDGNVLLKNAEPESASDRPSANAAAPVHSQTPLESTVPQPAPSVNNENGLPVGVGAAEAGFTIGGRPVQVPSRAQALTDNIDFSDAARADAAQAVTPHERLSNEQQRRSAEAQIYRDVDGNIIDLDRQARDLLEQTDWGRAEMDASLILAKEAHDRGDMATFRELIKRYKDSSTNSAQILQSTQKNIRTPEGKVAQAMQAVDEANEELHEGKTKAQKEARKRTTQRTAKQIRQAAQQSAESAAAQTASDAAEVLRRTGGGTDGNARTGGGTDGNARSGRPRTGGGGDFRSMDTPARFWWEWNPENGRRLASRLAGRVEPKDSRPKTTMQIILSDLSKFANSRVKAQKADGQKRTAVDIVRDYFANRAAYNESWETAQQELRERYKSDPEKLNALDEFLSNPILDGSGRAASEPTMIAAMLESADSIGISKKALAAIGQLGGKETAKQRIADDFVSRLGLERGSSDADIVESAVFKWVDATMSEDAARNAGDAEISKALCESGLKISELILQNWENRNAALETVQRYIESDLGATPQMAREMAQEISDRFYERLNTAAERRMNALFGAKERSAGKTVFQRFEEYLNLGAMTDERYRDIASQRLWGENITLTDAEINRIYALQQQANEARDAGDAELADRLEGTANRIIAGKMQPTLKEKIMSGFYNAMLISFRTLITRNAGGNLGLALVDQTLTKANSAVVDALIGKITGERYYAMPGAKYYREYGKGFVKGARDAYADYSTGIRTPRSGEQWNAQQAVRAQYQVFKSDVFNAIDRLVKFGLDIGDRTFYEATYKSRLEELTRLRDSRRLSPEQTARFDEWAPAEAAASALEAVFQQRGDGAEGLMSVRTGIDKLVKALTGVDMGGMAALPFTNTPGNVLDTTTDYIPLTGAVKNAVNTLREVRRGEFNQRRFSKATGRLLTGLELTAGAAGLAAAGAITGGGDDRSDKEALEQSGWQDYSFKVGNKYYSYDWIPIVGTILAGTADYLDAREYGEESVFGAAKTSLGTVGGMTALQGMNRMFGGYSGNIAAGLIGNLTALPGQAIPSVVGQTARATDSYERDTYDPRWWKQELNYLMNRVPGLRELLPEKIDLYGQPVELSDGRNVASKLFENLVSPGYLSEEQSDAVTQELLRLSGSGNAVSIPDVEKTAGLDGDGRKVKLTAEQYKQRQITRGQTLATVLTSAIGSPSYALLTDEQKAWVAEQAVKYAGAAANKELFENAGAEYTGNDYTDRLELSEVGTYLAYRAAFRELTDVQDEPSQEDFDVIKALLGQYSKVPEDVQTALDDVDGFKRFRQAAAKGIKLEHILAFGEANKTREEFKDVDRDGKYGKADKRWYFMQDGGTKSEFDKLWKIWYPGNSGK